MAALLAAAEDAFSLVEGGSASTEDSLSFRIIVHNRLEWALKRLILQ